MNPKEARKLYGLDKIIKLEEVEKIEIKLQFPKAEDVESDEKPIEKK